MTEIVHLMDFRGLKIDGSPQPLAFVPLAGQKVVCIQLDKGNPQEPDHQALLELKRTYTIRSYRTTEECRANPAPWTPDFYEPAEGGRVEVEEIPGAMFFGRRFKPA